jgi:hypothetical protein
MLAQPMRQQHRPLLAVLNDANVTMKMRKTQEAGLLQALTSSRPLTKKWLTKEPEIENR